MLIKNLHLMHFYTRKPTKVDGENYIKWQYKGSCYLNDQQDTNELDKTASGLVDFDNLKLRTNKAVNVDKTDGVSYRILPIGADGYATTSPQYVVESINKIGRSNLFICRTYNGE